MPSHQQRLQRSCRKVCTRINALLVRSAYLQCAYHTRRTNDVLLAVQDVNSALRHEATKLCSHLGRARQRRELTYNVHSQSWESLWSDYIDLIGQADDQASTLQSFLDRLPAHSLNCLALIRRELGPLDPTPKKRRRQNRRTQEKSAALFPTGALSVISASAHRHHGIKPVPCRPRQPHNRRQHNRVPTGARFRSTRQNPLRVRKSLVGHFNRAARSTPSSDVFQNRPLPYHGLSSSPVRIGAYLDIDAGVLPARILVAHLAHRVRTDVRIAVLAKWRFHRWRYRPLTCLHAGPLSHLRSALNGGGTVMRLEVFPAHILANFPEDYVRQLQRNLQTMGSQ